MKRIVPALLAITLAATATGCSGSKGKSDATAKGSDTAAASDSTSPTAVDTSGISPTKLPDVPVFKDERGGDIKDLKLGDCKTEAGKQVVSGSLTSSLNKPQDFLVTISWTTATGDVMGRGFKAIKALKPGGTSKFKIRATVSDGATRCVSGVSYGAL